MGILQGIFKARDKLKDALGSNRYSFYFGNTSAGKPVNEHTALQMTAVYPYIAKGAAELCDKISKYARFFADENGDERVDIRFYESEAELIIWQYIATWTKLTNKHNETLDKYAETLEKHNNTLMKCETYIEDCLMYHKALLIASRTLADYFYFPEQDDDESENIRTTRWFNLLMEQAENQAVCRVCGCTEENACGEGCYWVEPDLCSICADVR